jgi:hypothetical protein
MPYFTYDTSVIVSRKVPDLREMPRNFLMSSVVLMELTAGAADNTIRKLMRGYFTNITGINYS